MIMQPAQMLYDVLIRYAQHAASLDDVNDAMNVLLDRACAEQAERDAQIAEETARAPMDYRDWSPGPAADDRALNIARAIRAAATTPPADASTPPAP